MLKQDHETEGDLFVKISQLTNEYNPPIDACETYKITLLCSKEFEQIYTNTYIQKTIFYFIKLLSWKKDSMFWDNQF